MHLETAGKSCL